MKTAAATAVKTDIASALQAARAASAQVQGVIATLKQEREALMAKRATLRARNEYVGALPVNREDAKRFVLSTIDIIGSGFPARVYMHKLYERFAFPQRGYTPENVNTGRDMLRRPLSLADIAQCDEQGIEGVERVLGLRGKNFLRGWPDHMPVQVDAFYYFCGDAVKRKIEENFAELFPSFSDPKWTGGRDGRDSADHAHYESASAEELASSVADRRKEIDANDRQIAAIDTEVERIDAELAELGGAQ